MRRALLLLAVLAVLGWASVAVPIRRCSRSGESAGVPAHYDPIAGCFLLVGGRWRPAGQWRIDE